MPAGRDARQLQVIDPVLTEVARLYRPQGFVYNEVCPTINVDTLSGQYPIYDDTYWFANEQDNKISDRGETPEIEFSWSTDTYLAEDYGFKISITPRERQQAGSVGGAALRLESSKTEFLMQQMANAREKRLAAVLKKVSAGTPGQLNLGAAATTVFATSTAIEADFKTAKVAVYNKTGLTPNVAIIPYLKAYDMATNATLRDIWKYQVNSENFIRLGADAQGEDIFLPRWFQGCRLLIPKGALAQAGREGAAKSLTEVWGTSVRFLYVPENPGWGVPATCYQFQHEVISGSARAGRGAVIDRWSENDPRKDVIRAMECIDEKVCAPDAAYELTGT